MLRVDPPQLPELLDQHLDRDAGKRTALADLRDGATLATVRDLLIDADVLVTGYRPESLARVGLDWRSVHADFPHVVMVELDAWGRAGPWRQQRGFDSIVQAAVGVAHLYAGPTPAGYRPGALPVQALDHAAGYGMAAATLALLRRRRLTGAAGHAHLSLARTAHLLLDHPAAPHGTVEAPPVTLRAWRPS